jgi:hydrogenase nickel incorporation protein HypA/HybF
MHELTIVDSLVAAAVDEAQRRGAKRIVQINCRIGRLRQVNQQLLREVFEIARLGSAASAAVLDVTYGGTRLTCRDCAHCVDLDDWRFDCPRCGSSNVELSGGDEIELTSLELEVPDDYCRAAEERI